jgi:hypothetical protein
MYARENTIWIGGPLEKRLFGRLGRRWKEDIRIDIKEISYKCLN